MSTHVIVRREKKLPMTTTRDVTAVRWSFTSSSHWNNLESFKSTGVLQLTLTTNEMNRLDFDLHLIISCLSSLTTKLWIIQSLELLEFSLNSICDWITNLISIPFTSPSLSLLSASINQKIQIMPPSVDLLDRRLYPLWKSDLFTLINFAKRIRIVFKFQFQFPSEVRIWRNGLRNWWQSWK